MRISTLLPLLASLCLAPLADATLSPAALGSKGLHRRASTSKSTSTSHPVAPGKQVLGPVDPSHAARKAAARASVFAQPAYNITTFYAESTVRGAFPFCFPFIAD